jgi:hypothetical protein
MVILSAGRAEDVKTQTVFPTEELVLVCPAHEEDAYRDHNPDLEIVALPEGFPAGEAPVRQWIMDRWPSSIQLDDDLVYFHNMESLDGKAIRKLGPDEAFAVMLEIAGMARDAGIYLYGLTPWPHPTAYHCQIPFRITGFVIGGVVGIHEGSKLRFNHQLTAASDYWLSGLNAHYHRMCLVDFRHCCWDKAGTFSQPGGQQMHRSLDTEAEDTRLLTKAFGRDVIRPKKGSSISSQTSFGSQRVLQMPF